MLGTVEYDYADEDLGYNSGSGRGCVNDDGFWFCFPSVLP